MSYGLDLSNLNATRDQLSTAGTDPRLQSTYEALLDRCAKHLDQQPWSVTHKTAVPPSGDKHDYLSIGPYWWQPADASDDTPWEQRDGEVNPVVKTMHYDSTRLAKWTDMVYDLSIAWYLSRETKYRSQAIRFLETWFIHADTRQNANMKHAQYIPGVSSGRGIGLIDARHFGTIIDSLALLEVEDQSGYKQWFGEYYEWLTTSRHGREEDAQHNNHGTFYDAHVVVIALYLGYDNVVVERLAKGRERLAAQFDANCEQPHELRRTRPFHYSVFNLCAFTRLAQYTKIASDTNVKAWDPTVVTAIENLGGYLCHPDTFPHHDLTGIEIDPCTQDSLIPQLLMAIQEVGPRPQLVEAVNVAYRMKPTAREFLLWPLPVDL